MYNGEYEFDALIKGMEREVLDLKTAHQRPLGALNFFSKQENLPITLEYDYGMYYREFDVVVTIAEPTAKPPIVQTGWDTPTHIMLVDLVNYSVSANYTVWTYHLEILTENISSTTLKVGVKSSQPILSITRNY